MMGPSFVMPKLTLVRLAQEGRVATGDTVHTDALGQCKVAYVVNSDTIVVRSSEGRYHKLTGINFGPDARVSYQ
jgi:hypothetical protein